MITYLRWDTSISNQVSNCDGIDLEIYLDHKFPWAQEGLNCESLGYEVVTFLGEVTTLHARDLQFKPS